MRRFLLSATLAVSLFGICPQAHAAIITGVTVESAVQGNNFSFGPERLLDSDSMSDMPATASSTLDPDTIDGWLSEKLTGDPFPELVLDLGSNYDVDQLILWGWNQNVVQSRTWKDFTIEFSQDNLTFAASTPLLMNLPTGDNLAETANPFDVSGVLGSSNARYVRLKASTNFGITSPDLTQIFALGKLRFDGTAAVPEPSTLALALLGLLSLCMTGRRRRHR